MIVDSSAIVAMLRTEPEAERFAGTIVGQPEVAISAGNYLEAAIVVDKDGDPVLGAKLDPLLQKLNIRIAPVTAAQARIARRAYRDFGRGSGHPAKLNYGDCLAYALAMETGRPLLYKGDDFEHAGLARVESRP